MAVTVTVYPAYMNYIQNGAVDLDTDTINLALVSTAYNSAHDYFNDVTEVTGTGYSAGGATLGSKTIGVVGTGVFDAADVSWAASTITASYAVLYKKRGGASSADELIAHIAFGEEKVSSSATFTVAWNASGIFTVAQA